jgi:hypothetical protein
MGGSSLNFDTNSPTDSQTNRQTHRQTDRHTDTHTHTHNHTNTQIQAHTHTHISPHTMRSQPPQTLLARGANRDALNRAGQTPYQVAMLAGSQRVSVHPVFFLTWLYCACVTSVLLVLKAAASLLQVAQILIEFNPADATPVVERPTTFTRQVDSSIPLDRVSCDKLLPCIFPFVWLIGIGKRETLVRC